MKQALICFFYILTLQPASAQITITPAEMPVAGDTLRHSFADPSGSIDLNFTGVAKHWHFIPEPTAQAIDTFKKAYEVNPLYAATISLSATGYKVADSIPGISYLIPGIAIRNVYSFYETLTSPSAYAATFFAASIAGFPIAAHYTKPDAVYFFPLTYPNQDSSDFEFSFGIAGFGLKQQGYRKTKVDGWGEVMTPLYIHMGIPCIRLKSEIYEMDSVTIDSVTVGLPRKTIEYRWLVQGVHYPAMWVTAVDIEGAQIVTSIKFLDKYRPELDPVNVKAIASKENKMSAFPNPATGSYITLGLPDDWKTFLIEVYDAQSRSVGVYKNDRNINVQAYAPGSYIARITSNDNVYFVKFVK